MTTDARKAGKLTILWTTGYATIWFVAAAVGEPLSGLVSIMFYLWPFIATGMVQGPTKWAPVISLIPIGFLLAITMLVYSFSGGPFP